MLYRVFQEFINNTTKHAEAKNIIINIEQNDEQLILEISDDGKGFDIEKMKFTDGRGMDTMKTRIETFGGKSVLNSTIGEGTKLQIKFKWEP